MPMPTSDRAMQKASRKELRQPYQARAKMSLPRVSVPKGCSQEGRRFQLRDRVDTLVGSILEIMGYRKLMSRMAAISATSRITSLERKKVRRVERQ